MSIKWNELTINQWRPVLQCMMITNDNNLKKCILKIYEFQTQEEKNGKVTKDENEFGFNKVDAEEMSQIAEKLLRGEELTKGELAKSRNKMLKYWRQIMVVCKDHLKKNLSVEKQIEVNYQHQEEVSKVWQEEKQRCQEEGKPCSYGICSDCSH